MVGAGLALGSLAGLELAVREHFAGYRSHTLLLSGAVALALAVAVVLLAPGAVPALIVFAVGLAAFGAGIWIFTRAFKRRAGGAMFKVR